MINLTITELQACPCGEGKLLPVEDSSRGEGQIYLKGWFCPHCNTSWLFMAGAIVVRAINPYIAQEQ